MRSPSLLTPSSEGRPKGSHSENGFTFFVGLHQPADARHLDIPVMISYNRLRTRQSDIPGIGRWMLDSGAFTEITTRGGYRDGPEVYAAAVRRWARCGQLQAAVSQDYMCEPFALRRTGLSLADHQRLTIERYDALRVLVGDAAYLMPVLQGYLPEHYAAHVAAYGERLALGAWVGVGSVCKRNANIREIGAVLRAVKQARPDLKLHGFGAKLTALQSREVRGLLHSADSMAWSFNARKQGRDANDWREAASFAARVMDGGTDVALPMDDLWAA